MEENYASKSSGLGSYCVYIYTWLALWFQTKSSIDLAAAVASKGDSSSSSQSEVTQALPAEPVMSTVVARGGDAAMASQGDSSAAPSAHPHGTILYRYYLC